MGQGPCQQCQVKHWKFKGIIKDKKEYNAADVSQEGFLKNRFQKNKTMHFSYIYIFDW